jgi:hypothetical protein
MLAPAADLPIIFDDVSIAVGAVTILDRVTLTLAPGAPTVLIGPNGAGKSTLLRAAMGLAAPSRGRITWGARDNPRPTRRAIVFQRPAMLRRRNRRPRWANSSPWSVLKAWRPVPPGACPRASNSVSPWRGRSPETQPSCSSTSRPRASIPPPPWRSRT